MFVRVHDSAPGHTRARSGRERSFEVHLARDGKVQLRMWGSLPRGWVGHLTRGLAESQLSVLRGFARRGAGSEWIAAFELVRLTGSQDPMLLDYLELAAGPRRRRPTPDIRVDRHALEIDPTGFLRLDVEAPDQPGFLAGLIERLAFVRLEPLELEIRTGPEGVRDRFVLRSPDGTAPRPATVRVLDEILSGRLCGGSAAAG